MSTFICRFISKSLAHLFLDWLVENQYDFWRDIQPGEDIFHVHCYSDTRAKAIQEWMSSSKAV